MVYRSGVPVVTLSVLASFPLESVGIHCSGIFTVYEFAAFTFCRRIWRADMVFPCIGLVILRHWESFLGELARPPQSVCGNFVHVHRGVTSKIITTSALVIPTFEAMLGYERPIPFSRIKSKSSRESSIWPCPSTSTCPAELCLSGFGATFR